MGAEFGTRATNGNFDDNTRRDGRSRIAARILSCCFVVLLVSLWVDGVLAETAVVPLDLRAAVAYALDHNAAIAQRRATVAQDNATLVRLRAAELPSITGMLQNQLAHSQKRGRRGVRAVRPLAGERVLTEHRLECGERLFA